ncbi:MAG TPA: MFS transporter [Chitinophagales bacterium]|nr:MFS transporter [Chitinophagales bacterium]HRH54298.1 MFS transporter [Chitinophagales bacterium]
MEPFPVLIAYKRFTLIMSATKTPVFTGYQWFIIAILAFLQFTIVLDFMVLSPLGAILMPELSITPGQFSHLVSAYAYSACISGILASGFADKFDRKKMLLFFYAGFLAGTVFCGLAPDYTSLLTARIITGLFGGVMGAVVFAITTDLFEMQVRGRVMGFVQMAFAASQVLGLPIGLQLANSMNWHAPFMLIAGIGAAVFVVILIKMKPVTAHLAIQRKVSPFRHLWMTLSRKRYLTGFAATVLLATGGFMLMPFGSAFTVNNLGIDLDHIPLIYMFTGAATLIAGPIIGKFSDRVGKYNMFVAGSILSMILVLIYCNLGITPLWVAIVVNIVLFIGITARIISAQALMSGVPEPADRGAFMGLNSSIQQLAGGLAASLAGLIVVQEDSGKLSHYPILGYVVTVAMFITMIMMFVINKMVVSDNKLPNAIPAK